MMSASATSSRNWRMLGPRDERIDQAALQHIAEHEQHRRDRHQQDQRIEVERRSTARRR